MTTDIDQLHQIASYIIAAFANDLALNGRQAIF